METRLVDRDNFFQTILDAFPSPVFVVDDDVRIVEFNKAASRLMPNESEPVILILG